MNRQHVALVIVVSAVGFLAFATADLAGQAERAYAVPKTPWGDPDLQGVWNNNTVVPLERPEALAGRDSLSAEEVAERRQERSDEFFGTALGGTGFYNEFWFEYGQDTNRTSLIIEPPSGRLPALTPHAQQEVADVTATRFAAAGSTDHYLDLSAYDRCITRGMPGAMVPGFYNHNYHIMQTPDYVALVVEMIHDARIIPLDGRGHIAPSIRQWLGDSRGTWEGDTLVVETTNVNDKVRERPTFVQTVFGTGENLRLVERFTRVDADTIDYRFTVEDDSVFTGSWTAAIPMNRFDGTLFEYACHEGNYGLPNMLRGARVKEALASQP